MSNGRTIPLKPTTSKSTRQQKVQRERLLIILTVALVVAAWIFGYFTSGTDVAPLVPELLPGTAQVRTEGQLFIALDAAGEVIGYAALGSAPGYGGPIDMLVAVDPEGNILNTQVVTERESPGFFRLVTSSDLMGEYHGRPITDALQLGQDLDAVTGATVSAEGVAAAVRAATRQIADEALNVSLPTEQKPIQFGWPETILLLLFASGYLTHKWHNRKWKMRARWGTLIAGMVFLGFVYTVPLTITMIISLLSGYWPDWHNNLYWYLLIGGILFVTTVDAKNPYCSWFCPFGAFQECVAAISKAKPYRPRDLSEVLKWVQRGLALAAVVLGLALRRPGVASYEPFATLFDLRGTAVQWLFLALIVLASLVTYRPFCNYLCPLDPVIDFIAAARRWLKEGWAQWRKKPANV
ncbi:MAG: FMN-binding protein [Anaerolineaceae bacterium]|nr:FMN-binding protein [Anaerolineaceae bacterium]